MSNFCGTIGKTTVQARADRDGCGVTMTIHDASGYRLAAPRREIQTIDTRRWSICASAGRSICSRGVSPLSSHRFRIVPTGTAEATCHSVRPRPGIADRKLFTQVRNKWRLLFGYK